jgi:predicted DNA-binding protein YlxM (UPF0122 family)
MVMDAETLTQQGDWIAQLRIILRRRADEALQPGDRPAMERRSTKKAVETLLSGLHKGAGQAGPDAAVNPDIDKIVFNAVRMLVEDKHLKSKKNRSKLDIVLSFKDEVAGQFVELARKPGGLDAGWKLKIEEALQGLELQALVQIKPDSARPEEFGHFRSLWDTPEGRALATRSPRLAGMALSCANVAQVQALDLDVAFGNDKQSVLAKAMQTFGQWPAADGDAGGVGPQPDPATFAELVKHIDTDDWNDADQGLGPNVFMELWRKGRFDEIGQLVEAGVDTRVAARVSGVAFGGPGIHSGFVQPLQHYLAPLLRDIDLLDRNDKQLNKDPARKAQAAGAKKLWASINAQGADAAVTLTDWTAVKGSDFVKAFNDRPGTIWGFEHIRQPFVQAAHETDQGLQPLRMLELWDVVDPILQTYGDYEELLDNPDATIDKLVEDGVRTATEKLLKANSGVKYQDVQRDPQAFLDNLKRDAAAMLREYVAQLPKATFARGKTTDTGKVSRRERVSDVAGLVNEALQGGQACKAGLWWAKQEGQPVYYCLDGIDMDEVADYKKVKNRAIREFIDAGGQPQGAPGFRDVITFMEVREILKHWDELEDTVVFIRKGKVLAGDELHDDLQRWTAAIAAADREAGKMPAPPRSQFANELNAIRPGLIDDFPDGHAGDEAARDVVRKFGYLAKVAHSRPQIVLRYLIGKCGVLVDHGLVSKGLPGAAARLDLAQRLDAASVASFLGDDVAQTTRDIDDGLAQHRAALRSEIAKCHPALRAPLESALVTDRTASQPARPFMAEINAIQPGLFDKLPPGDAGASVAQEVLRSFGHLTRVANTLPQVVLETLSDRCGVLVDYGLVSKELPAAASQYELALRLDPAAIARFMGDDVAKSRQELADGLDKHRAALRDEIAKCHEALRAPLLQALQLSA